MGMADDNKPSPRLTAGKKHNYVLARRWLATDRDKVYSGFLSRPGQCLNPELARTGDRDWLPLLTNNDGDVLGEVAVFQNRRDAEDVQALYGGEIVRTYMAIGLEQQERRSTDRGMGREL